MVNVLSYAYDQEKMKEYQEVYDSLLVYAKQKDLKNTLISLSILPRFLFPKDFEIKYHENCYSSNINMDHALSIAKMLVDLHPNLIKEEEDVVLSVALCHVLVEMVDFEEDGEELTSIYHLNPKVNELIHIDIGNKRGVPSEQYYKNIQENKLSLLVKLADRSKIVGQLYMSSIDDAQMYVRETKNNFYSMCIYGKEHYPELTLVISVLMEKMKSLADVTGILSSRYIEQESLMLQDILNLREENARLRALIRQLKKS